MTTWLFLHCNLPKSLSNPVSNFWKNSKRSHKGLELGIQAHLATRQHRFHLSWWNNHLGASYKRSKWALLKKHFTEQSTEIDKLQTTWSWQTCQTRTWESKNGQRSTKFFREHKGTSSLSWQSTEYKMQASKVGYSVFSGNAHTLNLHGPLKPSAWKLHPI